MNKQTLRQYRSIELEIEKLEEERARIIARLQQPPPSDGLPKGKGGTGDPVGNAAARLADLQTVLNERIDALIDLRLAIEAALFALPADERLLMRYRYIDGMRWEQIAVELNYSYRHTTRLHGMILQKMSYNVL